MTTVSLQELTLFLFFLWLFKREGPRNAFGPPAAVNPLKLKREVYPQLVHN